MGIENELGMTMKQYIGKLQRRVVEHTSYFGVPTMRGPLDSWVYQEIITSTKPDVLVELGTYCGGLALYCAHLFDALGHGRVIALDINLAPARQHDKKHPRITFLEGDGTKIFPKVRELIKPEERVMVIEDAGHFAWDTHKLLQLYSPLVKKGDYYIVEDTLVRHGLDEGPGPGEGPWEGVEMFLKESKDFVSDRSREDFILTWNPIGFLKRIS